MYRRVFFLIAILIVGIGPSAGAADVDLEAKVDAFLAPVVDADLASGSILIAERGVVLIAKGYGPANREFDIPNTPATKFRLGSVTKQFTAMGIMILESQGALSTDDKLSRYYPDYPPGDRITLHQLLTHTSGIPNYNSLPDYYEKMLLPWSIPEVIEWVKEEPLTFPPGSQWGYSNTGYVFLAGIIEQVSGQPYEEFLNERIFAPLGMDDTRQDVATDVIPNRATGHYCLGETVNQAPYRDMPFTSGAGSLLSTVHDLYLWDQALYTGKLIPPAARERMFTPDKGNYAYGWFVEEMFGRKLLTHRGGINGFLANIDRFVDDSVLVVSLLNYESTFAPYIRKGLAAIALGEEYEPLLVTTPPSIPAAELAAYAGRYELTPDAILTVEYRDGGLFLQEPDGEPMPIEPQTPTRFWVRGINSMIRFDRDEAGAVRALSGMQGAHGFRAGRLP